MIYEWRQIALFVVHIAMVTDILFVFLDAVYVVGSNIKLPIAWNW